MSSAPSTRKPPRETKKAYHARMRALGLRPMTIWVPDVRSPDLEREARRQAALVAANPMASEDLAFVEEMSIPIDELDETT
jgi:hypothetical protein